MSIADFCTNYQLDDDVRERLKDEGIMNMVSLFYENEDELRNMGFNMGSIGEIKAALKRRLADKHPDIMVVTPRVPNALDINGGLGGGGGEGGYKGRRRRNGEGRLVCQERVACSSGRCENSRGERRSRRCDCESKPSCYKHA
ncbi:hypothetical protein R3P38DRAFT_1321103 [Favolaschia claudopus]|uniref:SAM domain-containing protein n=1 Tax=Favolaschia claudopus TaxID=2862362 RepID=A0AAW0AVQ8_9AGAR